MRHLQPLDAPGDEIAFLCKRCQQWIYNPEQRAGDQEGQQ